MKRLLDLLRSLFLIAYAVTHGSNGAQFPPFTHDVYSQDTATATDAVGVLVSHNPNE